MFKEGDLVLYLNYYNCVVVHKGQQYNGSQMYMIKQLNNNKIYVAHEIDLKIYK